MNIISIVPPGAIADLNQRIDHALTHRAVVGWLVTLAPTTDIRQLQARADAAARFVTEGRRHV
jgi:hypothetical protein